MNRHVVMAKDFVIFSKESLRTAFREPFRRKEFFHQLEFVGVQSIWVVSFCVAFASMVTVVESSYHMKLLMQNDSLVPGFATLLIFRELGAFLAGFLLTARVGAGYAAEVSLMKVTEQIDALKMLQINPLQYLVVPRVAATAVGAVLVTLIANAVCLVGVMFVSHVVVGTTIESFMTMMVRFVKFQDLLFSMIKGGVFGFFIALVSVFYGLRCEGGAEEVGHATTRSIVATTLLGLIANFILTWTFSHFY